jgi:mRNA-degrading endonuclease RelE of RelBE toxin-antitoxin system
MPVALEHMRGLSARDQRRIVDAVDRQLKREPDVRTRQRKPLRPNDLATWELRVGDFRVFYDILQADDAGGHEEFDEPTVSVLAVGLKRGSRLVIGGEEVEL